MGLFGSYFIFLFVVIHIVNFIIIDGEEEQSVPLPVKEETKIIKLIPIVKTSFPPPDRDDYISEYAFLNALNTYLCVKNETIESDFVLSRTYHKWKAA